MGLTGLQIFKLLPNTNCRKCGSPTCLAFAMKLAAGKESLDKCPDASESAKAALGAAHYVELPGAGHMAMLGGVVGATGFGWAAEVLGYRSSFGLASAFLGLGTMIVWWNSRAARPLPGRPSGAAPNAT